MVYAAQTKATDSAITVGAINNRPLCPIRAFDTDADRKAELDRIFEGGDGDNLIRVTRKQVVGWFGSNFAVNERGEVCKEWEV
jgi:hypothetical protein